MALNLNTGLSIGPGETHTAQDVLVGAFPRPDYGYKVDRSKITDAQLDDILKVHTVSSTYHLSLDTKTSFDYVVINDEWVRIEKCETQASSLTLPATIEDKPVLSLGVGCCEENHFLEEVICPSGVREIGSCAFRLCDRLRRLVLPDDVRSYSPSWVQHCEALREMVLPGQLDRLPRSVFDNPSLRILHAGPALQKVEAGACENSQLESFVLSDANPFLKSDGIGIYDAEGKVLWALAKPVASYELWESCQTVAKKAAKGMKMLTGVLLPVGLKRIDAFAFAHSGLESVDIPASVEEVGEKAFYHCSDLEQVTLHEGLMALGEAAFAESGLKALSVPATVQSLGSSITEKTKVCHSGSDCTFSVSGQSPMFWFDGAGGLYRKAEKGLHFIQLIDRTLKSYAVAQGTQVIAGYSFAFNETIEEVELPEGVTEIGPSAWRVCRRLRHVKLPDSVRSVGKEAFLDTALESFRVPACLESLGNDALVTAGSHHASETLSLHELSVSEDNSRFYVESGILCERREEGDRAIIFNDRVADVKVPESVTTIAPYAFNNAEGITAISLGARLKTIATCGLTVWSMIERIEVSLAEPLEGRAHFIIEFPQTDQARRDISLALGGSSWVNVPEIYRFYDHSLCGAHDYQSNDGISADEQANRMIARLEDPFLLTPLNRDVFLRTLMVNLCDICRDAVRFDDRLLLSKLADLKILDRDNIEEVIHAVQPLQDAAGTAFLLEMKRRRFGAHTTDFSL